MSTLMFGFAAWNASTWAFSESSSVFGSSPAAASSPYPCQSVISVFSPLAAAAPVPDDDPFEPLPPPQAAITTAIAAASTTTALRFDFDPIVCRDAIDAPPETFEVLRSSQPTTHH